MLTGRGQKYIFNFGSSLQSLRDAISVQRAGSSRAKIGFLGTSIVVGNSAGTGTNGHNGAAALCYPTKVKDLLRTAGLNARTDSWFGTKKVADGQLALYDTRMEWGSGWGATGTSAQNTLGGDRTRNNTSSSATAVRMTPSFAWNTADIYDLALSGGPASAAQPSIGGTLSSGVPTGETNLGAVVSQSNATTIYRKTTRTTGAAAASQAFNFKRIAAGTATVYLNGMDFWDSTNPDIAIYNWGQAGASSEFLSYNTQPYNPMAAISVVAPHAVFVDAVTNDVLNSGISYATIESQLISIINACRAAAPGGSGSVILATSVPVNVAGATQQRQQEVRDLVVEIANENGCAVLDNFNILGGSWAVANTAGLMGDNNHPNAAGHERLAKYAAWIIGA